eukprot:3294860-Prymnesium_polylepis.1
MAATFSAGTPAACAEARARFVSSSVDDMRFCASLTEPACSTTRATLICATAAVAARSLTLCPVAAASCA